MSHEFQLHGDEKIILLVRKHWFVLLREKVLSTGLSGLLPLVLLWIVYATGILPDALTNTASLWIFFTALWLMVIAMAIANIWTNYYLDLWIVTTKRIINVNQRSFFYRDVTTMPIEMIQDVSIEMHGIIETFLNFGTLKIHSAGPVPDDTFMDGIADPHGVKNTIIETASWETGIGKERQHGADIFRH
jgi:hypothetical protein